ncbi:Subtilisin-like protease SBT3.6 [Camellia lanceoleosa]|uniref:Subtilisin-like protease SBT3.6 n=1 Tax=Camellia lanceoleosa TaxID=1840588 RepID=A0ACC0H656_9ERIC|nr:Subtilisin-like protease SBT3.6 [Camellia lanceoleosa]
MPGVVSMFPNNRMRLHTTHSWDFMGLLGEETMEIPGYSTKNQVNVVIGFIDTGKCESGEGFNASTCNRKIIGARFYLSGYEAEEDPIKTMSFRSLRDNSGHGSHKASIAAGCFVTNMNYKGLAVGGARGAMPYQWGRSMLLAMELWWFPQLEMRETGVLQHTCKAMARIFSAKTVLGSQPAPQIAAFSSKGPNALTPEILKPDVAAPGLNILAGWSPAIGKLQSNIQSPSAIKSAIMTTMLNLRIDSV